MHISDESSNQSLETIDDPFVDDYVTEDQVILNGQPLKAKFEASEKIKEFGWYQLVTLTLFDLNT